MTTLADFDLSDPTNLDVRAVFADYLEDHDLATAAERQLLREHDGPVWVAADGEVVRAWRAPTAAELRAILGRTWMSAHLVIEEGICAGPAGVFFACGYRNVGSGAESWTTYELTPAGPERRGGYPGGPRDRFGNTALARRLASCAT